METTEEEGWITTREVLEILCVGDGIQPGDEVKFDCLDETGGLDSEHDGLLAVVVDERYDDPELVWAGTRTELMLAYKVRFIRREALYTQTFWVWKGSRLTAWRRPKKVS